MPARRGKQKTEAVFAIPKPIMKSKHASEYFAHVVL